MMQYKTNQSKTQNLSLVFLVCLLFFSFACGKIQKGDPQKGGKWFGIYRCSGCHGPEGKGGRAPAIAGTSLSYRKVLKQIRAGSVRMPSFSSESLSDQDATDIYSYLQSLKK
jgi:mono/diheme cytochrome c family protein